MNTISKVILVSTVCTVYRYILTGNHKTQITVLFRLLTQTIEAHKKGNWTVKSDASKIEKSSPMWFKHSMSIAQQLIPIYNTTVHKNKSSVALNVTNVRAIS